MPLNWQGGDRDAVDYFDVKGAIEDLADGLIARGLTFEPGEHEALRPGRTAQVFANGTPADGSESCTRSSPSASI